MSKGIKTALISVCSVVGAVIIAIIILAVCSSNFYKPSIDGARDMKIWIDGTNFGVGVYTNPAVFNNADNEGQKVYRNIEEKYNTTTKESVLTCIFGGAYGFEEKVEDKTTTLTNIKASGIVLEYTFAEEQTITLDGEVQKDKDGNTIKYNKVFIEVKNTADLTETYAYLYNTRNDDSLIRVTFLAKQAELYSYIDSLKEA